jgi:hypothetical protein
MSNYDFQPVRFGPAETLCLARLCADWGLFGGVFEAFFSNSELCITSVTYREVAIVPTMNFDSSR